MSGPLSKLRIIEMAGLGPCPLAGQLLADLGAEVTVIDRESGKSDPTDINRRNKHSIALDLKTPKGLRIAQELIQQADILIEGFRPGVMEKIGLGPTECVTNNPTLIYGRMTGWGQTGPLAQCAGHDINYLSLTGALHAIGHHEDTPVPPLNLVADYGGGTLFLLLGILSALYERSHSGKGQVIDAAMVDGVPAMMGLIHTFFARNEWSTQRERNLLDGGAPFYRCYQTADGQYLSVGPLEPQFFADVVKKLELPDTECATQYDQTSWQDKHDRYQAIFQSKTRDEWMALFEGSDSCIAPVLDFNEVEKHPHNQARNNFIRIDNVMQSAPAPRFSRTPTSTPSAPKAAGADTQRLLKELGYSEKEITQLWQLGVLK